jgi:hypothetical protein
MILVERYSGRNENKRNIIICLYTLELNLNWIKVLNKYSRLMVKMRKKKLGENVRRKLSFK